MSPCHPVLNWSWPVHCAYRAILLPLVFCGLCLSAALLPCAAQNPLPLTVSIAKHQSSVTVPFVSALVTLGKVPVQARINGKGPYTFQLDTGASVSLLSRDVANALKLPTIGKGHIITGTKAKASAEIRTAKTLQIGAATLSNMTLYVSDPPAEFFAQGILGEDFLTQFVVTMDYEHQCVTLTLPDKFTYKGKGDVLPFTANEAGLPFVSGSIEGVQGRFLIDSGSNGGVDLSQSFVQKNLLRDKYPRHVEYLGAVELAGTPGAVWHARADTVILGKMPAVHDVIISLTNSAYSGDGVIGSEILRQFTLTMDWPHQMFYLEKNALYGQKAVFNRAGFIPRPVRDAFDVVFVIANSPAAEAGLHVGDRLVEIAGQSAQTWTWLKLRDLVRGEPGTKLSLTVERDGKRIPIVLTLRDLL